MPQVIQLVSDRAKSWTQVCLAPKPMLFLLRKVSVNLASFLALPLQHRSHFSGNAESALGSRWLGPGLKLLSVQFSSVAQLCPTLWDPMNCSTPGLPVHHQLPEPTQTHVHWVSDAIQRSHPMLSPSSPALSLSQHQGLFKRVFSALCIRWPKYWSFCFNVSPSN